MNTASSSGEEVGTVSLDVLTYDCLYRIANHTLVDPIKNFYEFVDLLVSNESSHAP